ncbi:hypothetical protein Apa02nite_075860 [Actinoplanes palleronii]|uniref:non-specific serine/threonine protein kinase n=1 Tax=Actinoplanes palleronii TaxID=113570 RepID=A0ABQ4BLD5_9ACTN|nr:hypothetical protein Apa02nite_075860 [Actinoplanes palleronii]
MAGVDRTDDRVGGRYRLLEVIGTGGMGRVWRGEDDLLLRTVAVKEIRVPSEARLVAQVMREARAAARLDHPGVVKVFDVVWRQGHCWIVMEYVESRSLHRVVQDDGLLSYAKAAQIGLQMLAALRAAHDAGVLHRDVKPDNVLLTNDGRVVLTDFGLATLGDTDTGPDPRLGSPSYIAPERLETGDAGVPSDLWSFGATLYAAVEGRAPHGRGDAAATIRALLTEPPDPPELAGPLAPLLLDLLRRDPEQRPSSAEVESRLRAIVDGPPAVRRARKPYRGRLVLAGSALLVLAGGGAALAASRQGPDQQVRVVAPPAAPAALVASPLDACGFGADPRPVVAATTFAPAGLPKGWIWFRDPSGFALGLPAGWQRSTSGNEVCFSDAPGRRAFSVNVSPVVTQRPLAYWQGREKAARTAGTLPGYERISMGVLLLKRGAADWEYTWRPDSDTVRHERRVLVAVTDQRSYLLRWTAADADWTASLPQQRQMLDLFASAR